MTVLITGAGLVGSQVAAVEIVAGRRPVVFDLAPDLTASATVVDLDRCDVVRGDIRSSWQLARTVEQYGVRRVVHTAANPGLTPGAQRDPYSAVEVNIVASVNILELARCSILVVPKCTRPDKGPGRRSTGGTDIPRRATEPSRPGVPIASTPSTAELCGLRILPRSGLRPLSRR
jgi:hypothetical protein